jgi:glycosyltransferase involved in cell wall biosynthesis
MTWPRDSHRRGYEVRRPYRARYCYFDTVVSGLAALPLDDVDENGAMVNAIQRHATVIVQKSLAEGFGLTVAEGMWKGRPVVGSAVGGIMDQIAAGTGGLLPDPADLAGFGSQLRWLLDHPSTPTGWVGQDMRISARTTSVTVTCSGWPR